MSSKIKFLIQKRTSLKSQIKNLANTLEQGNIDNVTLKLRSARLSELYRAFEDHNDQLMILNASDIHVVEFENIQEQYYALAGKIETILNRPSVTETATVGRSDTIRGDVFTAVRRNRKIKLPEVSLPTFDGKYHNWLSFKNAFNNLIDSQSDLSDVDKLHYLKSALIGEAANKIKIFSIEGTNYAKAWEVLTRSYEVKRVLIAQHLSLLLNLPVLDRETTSGLSKLADDAQQHDASLKSLGVSVYPEMIVHLLESKLPKSTAERWDATIERDEVPSLDKIYEFLYKSAVCASKRERAKDMSEGHCVTSTPCKKKRIQLSNRALIVNASNNCIVCKNKRHPLFACDKFKQMPVEKRIEVVKVAKMCYNCMRSHRGEPCQYSNCTICQRRHNTLLHSDKYANKKKSVVEKEAVTTA